MCDQLQYGDYVVSYDDLLESEQDILLGVQISSEELEELITDES